MAGKNLQQMRINSYEEFQIWLANELEVRENLEKIIGSELDFGVESLDILEEFLLKRYKNPDELLGEPEILDAAARHIGIVMLFNVDGSKWAIDLENEKSVYYRLPIIRLADRDEECPLSLATASMDRRTGDYLSTVIKAYIEDYNQKGL